MEVLELRDLEGVPSSHFRFLAVLKNAFSTKKQLQMEVTTAQKAQIGRLEDLVEGDNKNCMFIYV